jgi:hypothetical protein
LFEEISEAVTFSIPVKGLSDEQKQMIVKKFPELASQFKSGNTGHLLMLEPAVWQNIKKQITLDRALRGLGPAEELLTKIDGALELIQGRAATDKNRAQSPDFGQPGMTPTIAKPTGLNHPSQSATAPRYSPPPKPATPPLAKQAKGGTPSSTMREPERELDPLDIDTDALHRAHGTTPSVTPAMKAKSLAQSQAQMKGAGKPKTTVLDPKDQKKTDDMEDPSTWAEGVKLLNKLMREAQANEVSRKGMVGAVAAGALALGGLGYAGSNAKPTDFSDPQQVASLRAGLSASAPNQVMKTYYLTCPVEKLPGYKENR